MSSEYFIRRGPTINGPLTLQQVRSALLEKKLITTDEIASSAEGPWNRVATVYKDVADGRQPRLLSDRKPVSVRKPVIPRPDRDSLPTADIEPAQDDPELTSLNEAIEMEGQMPRLPPPRKVRSELAKAKPDTKSGGGIKWVGGSLVGVLILGAIVFATTLLKDRSLPTVVGANTSAPPASAQKPLIDGSSVNQQLKKIQRTLGLNKQEQEKLRNSIRQSESRLTLNEISASTVFQQQVNRIDACIEMTAIISEALGAKPADTKSIVAKLTHQDILADGVFQQMAGHLSIYTEIMSHAVKQSGVSPEVIAASLKSAELRDQAARNALQQIAARADAVQEMAGLLAKQLGAPAAKLSTLSASASLDDQLSDTVYQQMSARQAGLVKLLGAAALAQGADPASVTAIESGMETDDILVKTAQQQYSARIKRGFEMTTILAQAIVMK